MCNKTRYLEHVMNKIHLGFMLHRGQESGRQSLRQCDRRLTNGHYRRRGIVLIWTAILILVMILFVGLSLDTGKVVLNLQQLQDAADAAALAGALYVRTAPPQFTRERAAEVGLQNTAGRLFLFKPVQLQRSFYHQRYCYRLF